MKNSTLFSLIDSFDFNGVSFVSIKNYCSDKSDNSEVADIVINVGTSYEKMKISDLETLKKVDVSKLVTENFGQALLEQALAEKIQSIVAPNVNRSNGQKDAYIKLNSNGTLKYCKETENVMISGVVVRKNVIIKGEFKEVKSKPLTLAKKYLDKVLDLKLAKIRYYKISNIIANVKVSGNTIEIE
jgi:hypothetical protein